MQKVDQIDPDRQLVIPLKSFKQSCNALPFGALGVAGARLSTHRGLSTGRASFVGIEDFAFRGQTFAVARC